ncbi:UNVERIFIED_CONTAM: hypothetical protein FKN15_050883 [Acipenser sinensis]
MLLRWECHCSAIPCKGISTLSWSSLVLAVVGILPHRLEYKCWCAWLTLPEGAVVVCSLVFQMITSRESPTSTHLCSWLTPPEGDQPLLTCVPGSLHQREPNLYSPVFLAHSNRGSPTSTHLCSWLTPPEGAQPLLTCVPGSLHQREPNLYSSVLLAHSTRGSPTDTYLCC